MRFVHAVSVLFAMRGILRLRDASSRDHPVLAQETLNAACWRWTNQPRNHALRRYRLTMSHVLPDSSRPCAKRLPFQADRGRRRRALAESLRIEERELRAGELN